MLHDLINDAITNIRNHERVGKRQCTVKPISKLLINILDVFQKDGYIGEFEILDDSRGGSIRINLVKQINDCGIIKPRFAVKHDDFPRFEKRFLPSRDFGTLVVSTPKGVMNHKMAKEKGIGGRLLAYVY